MDVKGGNMNKYQEMKERQQKEVNEFPMAFAFNKEQFDEGMRELGLDPSETDKVCRIPAGGFCRIDDVDRLRDMLKRHRLEMQSAIENDSTGEGFIYDMFYAELCNHEFSVTYDSSDAINALGLTQEKVLSDSRLHHGINRAIEAILNKEIA